MSCDWLAADVTVAVIGQTINLLPRERCYRRKMVTDLLKTLYSITSDKNINIQNVRKKGLFVGLSNTQPCCSGRDTENRVREAAHYAELEL